MTKKEHNNFMKMIEMTSKALEIADDVAEKNPAYKQFRDDMFKAWISLNKASNEEAKKVLKQGR